MAGYDRPNPILAGLAGQWKMLGNGPDPAVGPGFPGCGNCFWAGWANGVFLASHLLGGTPYYPAWPMILAGLKPQVVSRGRSYWRVCLSPMRLS